MYYMNERKLLVSLTVSVVFVFCLAPSAWAAWGKTEIKMEQLAVKFAREVERGGYNIVRTDELKQWVDQKKEMLIIDTMPYEKSYKKNHIPGAVQFLFPIPEMTSMDEKTKTGFLKLLGPNKKRTIVFYCGFTKCGRSHNGAMWAVKLGYTNAYRCPGGIKAWMEADYPVGKIK
jgi:rhodanese-related sulfurtransferase